jgi:sarcosine oxidase subunit gamma
MAELIAASFHARSPVARQSPLAAWYGAFEALPSPVRVAEHPFLVQLNVRADAATAAELEMVLGATLPVDPCTARTVDGRELLWLGPDEWLIVTDPVTDTGAHRLEGALVAAIGGRRGAVTDVSAQRTMLTLTGSAAAEVLARGCALDLYPSQAPAGTCVQTLLARTGIIIVVRDDSATSFALLVRSSFADYLAAWLIDACTEFAG